MKTFVLNLVALFIATASFCQTGPQLEFVNPVLVHGNANQQGAVYRFPEVSPGVDAEVKLKKFSRNDIVMATVDNAALGWNKAFQPEFGLPGMVQPFQSWFIDFEMTFYDAGTNHKRRMDTIDLTALDVDGDNNSISEYVTYDRPNSVAYSTVSFLTSVLSGVLGQPFECEEDHITSPLIICILCGGDGMVGWSNNNECGACDGNGKIHSLCLHPFEGGSGNTVNGPVNNFVNIDTSATQVMATYQFLNKDKIKFRYGGRSSFNASNGSGIRLNSTWFRKFSLAPIEVLPIKLMTFSAILNNSTKVDLQWSTASEINTNRFIIEKSTDGKSFNEAGVVFAYGNSTEKRSYSFTDNITATNGAIYYRLRSVDEDGKAEYSPVRMIRTTTKLQENTATILTYPNPVVNEIRITIPSTWQSKQVSYEIVNANAQVVKKMNVGSGSQTEIVDLSKLAPGFYVVRVICGTEIAQQKIIKK